ncbi:DUF2681 domain-containing protein [Actinobacillus pleuropneumoniae]|uniref:DUF2681 domain-containing protein n=1 Tax=Actinobacillus pleuropneumoniae TaxID=715 RepID=UPI002AC8580A|nr:DUF2681 domain-containing protein [Actinobacillus pleuropneumoniae]
MIVDQIIPLAVLAGSVVSFVGYKSWQVSRERKKNAQLTAENAQKQAEIQAQKTEIKNAQIKQKNHDDVKRSNASTVDQQLHAHGYFRDDDRLHGVRADLPKSSRYDGDEASSAGSQSDL